MNEYFVLKKILCSNCGGKGKDFAKKSWFTGSPTTCRKCYGRGYSYNMIELEKAINYLLNTNKYKRIDI